MIMVSWRGMRFVKRQLKRGTMQAPATIDFSIYRAMQYESWTPEHADVGWTVGCCWRCPSVGQELVGRTSELTPENERGDYYGSPHVKQGARPTDAAEPLVSKQLFA